MLSAIASSTGPSVLFGCYMRHECHSMRLDFLYANPQLIPKIPFKMHFKTSKTQQNSSQNAKFFAARLDTCLYQSGRPQRKFGFYHSKKGFKSRRTRRASGRWLTTTSKPTLRTTWTWPYLFIGAFFFRAEGSRPGRPMARPGSNAPAPPAPAENQMSPNQTGWPREMDSELQRPALASDSNLSRTKRPHRTIPSNLASALSTFAAPAAAPPLTHRTRTFIERHWPPNSTAKALVTSVYER